jgi:hypothetical protein
MKGSPFPGPADLLIQRFADHKANCNSRRKPLGLGSWSPCDCGFPEAMKVYQESLKKTVEGVLKS